MKTVTAIGEAARQIEDAANAKKCWPCGCLHSSLAAIRGALPDDPQLRPALEGAQAHLTDVRYDCLGCEECFPALAINALAAGGVPVETPSCPTDAVDARSGWPPLPGSYRVLRYQAAVAICTLTDHALMEELALAAPVALVGTLETENLGIVIGGGPRCWVVGPGPLSLRARRGRGSSVGRGLVPRRCRCSGHGRGQAPALRSVVRAHRQRRAETSASEGIERLIANIVANPNVRALVVCGRDSRQAIGHLPGQSLVALARHGVDEHVRIVGAKGKRPILKNISAAALEHFARYVEVIDLVEESRPSVILDRVLAIDHREPAPSTLADHALAPLSGHLPSRMVPDPNGYFVVYVHSRRSQLSLEHFGNDGVLRGVIAGRAAAELYTVAIEHGMLSRLEHAAYLGRELARAEHALLTGERYTQDGVAVAQPSALSSCGCSEGCGEENR